MNYKVGQYARFNDGSIVKINDYLSLEEAMNDKAKIVDTPMELIKVGDLVKSIYHKELFYISFIQNNVLYAKYGTKMFAVLPKDITKIFTPNSKGDYIKQWERDE